MDVVHYVELLSAEKNRRLPALLGNRFCAITAYVGESPSQGDL